MLYTVSVVLVHILAVPIIVAFFMLRVKLKEVRADLTAQTSRNSILFGCISRAHDKTKHITRDLMNVWPYTNQQTDPTKSSEVFSRARADLGKVQAMLYDPHNHRKVRD